MVSLPDLSLEAMRLWLSRVTIKTSIFYKISTSNIYDQFIKSKRQNVDIGMSVCSAPHANPITTAICQFCFPVIPRTVLIVLLLVYPQQICKICKSYTRDGYINLFHIRHGGIVFVLPHHLWTDFCLLPNPSTFPDTMIAQSFRIIYKFHFTDEETEAQFIITQLSYSRTTICTLINLLPKSI